jgi:hypothetical protein
MADYISNSTKDTQASLATAFSKHDNMYASFKCDGDVQEHAFYNETIAEVLGIDAGRVGTAAISTALEDKQTKHLAQQLPDLYKKLQSEEGVKSAQLKMMVPPTWLLVEDLAHTYGRLCQAYASGQEPDRAGPTVHGGVCPGSEFVRHWRNLGLQTESWRTTFEGTDVDYHTPFQACLNQLLKSFIASVSASAIYNDPGTRHSVLKEPTESLVERLQTMGLPIWLLEQYGKDAEKHRLPDSGLARDLGKDLAACLQDQCETVLAGLKDKIFELLLRFFDAVAHVEFTMPKHDKAKGLDTPTQHRLVTYKPMFEKLKGGAKNLLENTWQSVMQQMNAAVAHPDVGTVDAHPGNYSQTTIYDMLEAAVLSYMNSHSATPAVQQDGTPPAGYAWKRGESIFHCWGSRYIQVCPSAGGQGGGGLMVYYDESRRATRPSSIANLEGCTVMKATQNIARFVGTVHGLIIHSQRMSPTQLTFWFQSEAERDSYIEPIQNMSAGRKWNVSADVEAATAMPEPMEILDNRQAHMTLAEAWNLDTQASEARNLHYDEAIAAYTKGMECLHRLIEAEPNQQVKATLRTQLQRHMSRVELLKRVNIPTPTRTTSMAFDGMSPQLMASLGSRETAKLLKERGSPIFKAFLDTLSEQRAPGSQRIKDEIRAEAVRIWTLQYVQFKNSVRFGQVDTELKNKFFDTNGGSSPFAEGALFREFGLSKMILDDQAKLAWSKTPEQLMELDDGMVDRKQKMANLKALRDIIRVFEDSGLQEFGGSATGDQFQTRSQLSGEKDRQKAFLDLANRCQTMRLGELGVSDSNGDNLDWPQLCVVGGQCEGKSTLLSSIVSCQLEGPLNFLPEGSGMVTKCPIAVQMGSKSVGRDGNVHTASVYAGHGGADLFDGNFAGTITCGGGGRPDEADLNEFGDKVRQRITQMQNHLVSAAAGKVSDDKIIVKIDGPSFPNLSLVDLPGLRQCDDLEDAGLKEQIEHMVTRVITNPNSVIIAVGDACVDPAGWVGRAYAQKADPMQQRTTVVCTKVDKVCGVSGVDTSLAIPRTADGYVPFDKQAAHAQDVAHAAKAC